jgi:hypothetical protein
LNGPHEFDKHEPVPKENRHEEIGERAIAAQQHYGKIGDR